MSKEDQPSLKTIGEILSDAVSGLTFNPADISRRLRESIESTNQEIRESIGSFHRAIRESFESINKEDLANYRERIERFNLQELLPTDAVGVDRLLPFYDLAKELDIPDVDDMKPAEVYTALEEKMRAIAMAEAFRKGAVKSVDDHRPPKGQPAIRGNGRPKQKNGKHPETITDQQLMTAIIFGMFKAKLEDAGDKCGHRQIYEFVKEACRSESSRAEHGIPDAYIVPVTQEAFSKAYRRGSKTEGVTALRLKGIADLFGGSDQIGQ